MRTVQKRAIGVECFYFSPHMKQTFKLDTNISIFTAELYAILKVMHLIENDYYRNVVILIDSKSAMRAIADKYNNRPTVTG